MGCVVRKTCNLVLGLILLTCLSPFTTRAGASDYIDPNDWPMTHRTPDENRMIPEEIAPEPGELEIAWEYKLDNTKQRINNFIIVDKRVYFNWEEGDKNDGIIRCLDAMTGKPVWETKTYIGQYTKITAFKGMLFFVGNDKNLYCIECKTGNLIWKKAFRGSSSLSYYEGSLIAIDSEVGILFINPFTGDTDKVIGLYKKSNYGEYLIYEDFLYISMYSKDYSVRSVIRANLLMEEVSFVCQFTNSNLYILNVYDDNIYLVDYPGTVYCFDINKKCIKWTLETKGYMGVSQILKRGGFLYFWEQGSIDFARSPGNSFLCVDAEKGEIVWSRDFYMTHFSQPIMYGNLIMLGVESNGLQTLNALTGETIASTFQEQASLWLKAISRKMIYVYKAPFYESGEPDSIVCFRQKICK